MAVYRNIIVDIPRGHVTIEKQSGGKPALVKYVLEAPYDKQKGYATPKRTPDNSVQADFPCAVGESFQREGKTSCKKNRYVHCMSGH